MKLHLMILVLAACACDPDNTSTRSGVLSAEDAAADMFKAPPLDIEEQYHDQTIELWLAAQNDPSFGCFEHTHQNGDLVETCCANKVCCTNNSTANKYTCKANIRRPKSLYQF
jgi:hypothetical protein